MVVGILCGLSLLIFFLWLKRKKRKVLIKDVNKIPMHLYGLAASIHRPKKPPHISRASHTSSIPPES